ncbi:MAG: hydrolase family protein [Hydrocarboniphaga sp.]|uniref:fumarylacetoacetate hydrolase family protein n=1 Tax=Hydrocarboniphaga sp. TaxID=2033016 RepID=UPI00261AA92B|nr:fumarylacetoacetate hydrolase family protein [Hydrocarboniphaga sp.]MDB5969314.1 hydrolase family protein [Hydrocarboniphaga sp.]
MKRWIRFKRDSGETGFGTLDQGQIAEYQGASWATATASGARFPVSEVSLLSPCTPSKVVALWNNFHELSAKLGKAAPRHPLFLIKPASSLAGPGDPIIRPISYAGKIAYEGELGIVIGKTCSNVSVEEASNYILGYTCVNDVTAAELLNEDVNFPQWCRSKGFDSFSCIGPVIADEFDWKQARVVTRLDGVERQNYPLSDMIFSPEQQVSLISEDMTLLPGDVIACGTSIGIGSIKDGATVEVFIEGIGSLSNTLMGLTR